MRIRCETFSLTSGIPKYLKKSIKSDINSALLAQGKLLLTAVSRSYHEGHEVHEASFPSTKRFKSRFLR